MISRSFTAYYDKPDGKVGSGRVTLDLDSLGDLTLAEALTLQVRTLPIQAVGLPYVQPEFDEAWSIVCGSAIVGTITMDPPNPLPI